MYVMSSYTNIIRMPICVKTKLYFMYNSPPKISSLYNGPAIHQLTFPHRVIFKTQAASRRFGEQDLS